MIANVLTIWNVFTFSNGFTEGPFASNVIHSYALEVDALGRSRRSSMDDKDGNHPQFIYDGRRMRSLSDRKFTDYASPAIYTRLHPTNQKTLIFSKITKNLQHISVNKVRSQVHCLAFTKDTRRLITGSASGEFTLWNSLGFNFETILQAHESCVRSLAFSDKNLLLSGDANGTIKYWDPAMTNINAINAFSDSLRDISFSPFFTKFAAGADTSDIKIFDLNMAKEENTFKSHLWDVKQVKWHPTKALICSAGKDTSLKLWDPRKGLIATEHYHKNTIFSLRWSKDGNYLFSGGRDQCLRILDIRNMKIFTYKSQNSDISAIAQHPTQTDLLVSASATGHLHFYQTFIPDPIDSLFKAHDHVVWCAEYHPIGHVLATGSLDQSVRFWTRKGDNRPIDRSNPSYHPSQNSENVDQDPSYIPGLV